MGWKELVLPPHSSGAAGAAVAPETQQLASGFVLFSIYFSTFALPGARIFKLNSC